MTLRMRSAAAVSGIGLLLCAGAAEAAESSSAVQISVIWVVPFAGLLLSLALFPLLAPKIWHLHYGKIVWAWALLFIFPYGWIHGSGRIANELWHTFLLEYLPFVLLLGALFTVSGGLRLTGNLRAGPGVNTAVLLTGTIAASFMGTTGASLLLIRPLIGINRMRRHKTHVFIFFIFLVANVGGALTPLGDPPLFLGYLEGVPFFWPLQHLHWPTLFLAICLLTIFYLIDSWHFRKTPHPAETFEEIEKFGLLGKLNILWLAATIAVVLLRGSWRPEVEIMLFGVGIGPVELAADFAMLLFAWLSFRLTPRAVHRANEFNWAPMAEVGIIFGAIFVTIIPALAIMRAGGGDLGRWLFVDGVPNDHAFFWATGLLSSVLDNAPTYLVFFNLAGGDTPALIGPLAKTLAAISAGAVYFGALTYIGNAPNFMVRSLAESHGIQMPGFFGYIAWAGLILLPLLLVTSLIFF